MKTCCGRYSTPRSLCSINNVVSGEWSVVRNQCHCNDPFSARWKRSACGGLNEKRKAGLARARLFLLAWSSAEPTIFSTSIRANEVEANDAGRFALVEM